MYKLIQWFSCVGSTSSSYLLYLIKWYGPPSINFDVAHTCLLHSCSRGRCKSIIYSVSFYVLNNFFKKIKLFLKNNYYYIPGIFIIARATTALFNYETISSAQIFSES
jgi:hypothetical protein